MRADPTSHGLGKTNVPGSVELMEPFGGGGGHECRSLPVTSPSTSEIRTSTHAIAVTPLSQPGCGRAKSIAGSGMRLQRWVGGDAPGPVERHGGNGAPTRRARSFPDGRRCRSLRSRGRAPSMRSSGSAIGWRHDSRSSPETPTRCAGGCAAKSTPPTQLLGRTRFAVPEPVAIGEPGAGYPLPWLVQTWLPGTTATEQDPSTSAGFAHDLGELITDVRSIDVAGRRFAGAGPGRRAAGTRRVDGDVLRTERPSLRRPSPPPALGPPARASAASAGCDDPR